MTQQPAWNPGAPQAPRRKQGWLVGLLVAGAVVLLAVALVVVRPWEDDDTAAGSKPEPRPSEITGDINGDGRGDAVAVFLDLEDLSISTHTWSNTGSSFEAPTSEDLPFGSADEPLIGDWDGDGARTVIGWDPVSGSIRAWDESFDDVELSDVGGDDDFSLVAGDFDGDGRTDIAAADSETDGEFTIFVLLSNGDGFDAPAEWATVAETWGEVPDCGNCTEWMARGR